MSRMRQTGRRICPRGDEIAQSTAIFLAAASAAKSSGGRLIFTESRPPVRDILKRLRLHSVLHTIPGYEEALAEARRK